METVLPIMAILVETVFLIMAILALWFILAVLLAKFGRHSAVLEAATTAFVVRGETVRDILPNVDGFRMSTETDKSGRRWLIRDKRGEDYKKSLAEKIATFLRMYKYEVHSNGVYTHILYNSFWLCIPFSFLLWRVFGVKWISILYPGVKIHKFNLGDRGRLHLLSGPSAKTNESSTLGAERMPLRDRIMKSIESPEVKNLLFVVPRPIFMENIELGGDNSKINLLLLVQFRQVIPTVPVFDLKGRFFDLLDSAVQAVLLDFFASHRVAVFNNNHVQKGEFAYDDYNSDNNEHKTECLPSALTYAHWIRLKKTGHESPIERHIHRHGINASEEYMRGLSEELSKYLEVDFNVSNPQAPGSTDTLSAAPMLAVENVMPHGMIERFGFGLTSFRIIDWEPSKETEDLSKAVLKKEIEARTAEGVREKAYGERDAQAQIAIGEAARFEAIVAALISNGVSPHDASSTAATYFRMNGLKNAPNLTTYIEGGASVSPTIPVGGAPKSNNGGRS